MPPLPEPLARFLLPGEGERPSKRERTRRQLLHATVEVIASRGVAGTTIQEIARVAGMAPGTVYNHFSTREEIFEALALALFTTLNERVVQSYQHIEDGAQRMSIGMRRFLWLAEVSAPWALLMIQLAMAHPQAIELVKPYSLADLRRAKAQGRFDVVDEEAAIDMVFGTCIRAQVRIAQGLALQPFGRDAVAGRDAGCLDQGREAGQVGQIAREKGGGGLIEKGFKRRHLRPSPSS